MGQNVYDVSVLSWAPDQVEPQYTGSYPPASRTVKLAASTTYPKGALIGELTATKGTFGLYVHSGTGGLGAWQAILPHAVVTDASGNIFDGAQASEELIGCSAGISIDAWVGGAFRMADVTPFDANAVTDGPARLHGYSGKVADSDYIFVI